MTRKDKVGPLDEAFYKLIPDFDYTTLDSLKELSEDEKLNLLFDLAPHLLDSGENKSKYHLAYIEAIKGLNWIGEIMADDRFSRDKAIEYIAQVSQRCEDIIVDTEDTPLMLLEKYRKSIAGEG